MNFSNITAAISPAELEAKLDAIQKSIEGLSGLGWNEVITGIIALGGIIGTVIAAKIGGKSAILAQKLANDETDKRERKRYINELKGNIFLYKNKLKQAAYIATQHKFLCQLHLQFASLYLKYLFDSQNSEESHKQKLNDIRVFHLEQAKQAGEKFDVQLIDFLDTKARFLMYVEQCKDYTGNAALKAFIDKVDVFTIKEEYFTGLSDEERNKLLVDIYDDPKKEVSKHLDDVSLSLGSDLEQIITLLNLPHPILE